MQIHFSFVFLLIFLRVTCSQTPLIGWSMFLVVTVSENFTSQSWAQRFNNSIEEQRNEATRLYKDGESYELQGEYPSALEAYRQAVVIYVEIGDHMGEGNSLRKIGQIHYRLANYDQALVFYHQALDIAKEANDLNGEYLALNNIGVVYIDLSQYNQALLTLEQALKVVKMFSYLLGEGRVLNNIGLVYFHLGQYNQALDTYQQALSLAEQYNSASTEEKTKQRRSISITLQNIGWTYQELQNYSLAIENYQRALDIRREIGDRSGEAETLQNLGATYYLMKKFDLALPVLEQAASNFQGVGNRDGLAHVLNNLGAIYTNVEQFSKAWEIHNQALAIFLDVGDRAGQQLVLSDIGDLLLQQNQTELAIVFYKRSVNVTESIRRDIQSLPIEQRQSYTDTIADTYRTLADLLLQQDRVLEAQQVLDLLKVQEVEDYLRQPVRGTEQTGQGIPLLPSEQQLSDSYDALLKDAIAQGQEQSQLDAIPSKSRTPAQQQRLLELRQAQNQLRAAFVDFLAQPEVQAAIQNLQFKGAQAIDTASLGALHDRLQNLPDAVLLYPLILPDRLELVLLAPNTTPVHYSVPVGRVEFNHAISDFLTALKDPNADVKPAAQRLYNWLIRPIEAELAKAGTQTILYAPDGQLRYIPLAALYDGKQWLVERFRIDHITAVSLFSLDTRPVTQPHIFAGAYGEGRVNITRGETPFSFGGLPFAKAEVEAIGNLFPNTTELVDRAFTRSATVLTLNDYNIVHFATHAMFNTGAPEDSFIVLGDGDTLTLRDISSLDLHNVDLMVLSGCQTAVNSANLGDGKEILGFGYQIQSVGARAAIASLWPVDDGGTEALMSRFYALLHQGGLSKAAALQQAQIDMIHERVIIPSSQRNSNLPPRDNLTLSHPHYWAPFILIGNGL